MKFEILGAPVGKKRPRFSTIHGYAQAIKPKEDVIYENLVKICFQSAKPSDYDLYDKPISMVIAAHIEIPKSYSKKKREQAIEGNLYPQSKPDADNIAKIICDALNQVAYKDDTQVVALTILKIYDTEPKVIVTIEECC